MFSKTIEAVLDAIVEKFHDLEPFLKESVRQSIQYGAFWRSAKNDSALGEKLSKSSEKFLTW